MNINYFGDAANLFSNSYELKIIQILYNNHNVKNVTNVTNYDERVFQRELINKLDRKLDIVVLGSSRVMTIQSEYFNNQTLINNGVAGASIEDIIAIFQMYKNKKILPKKIILGIDPWIFNINNNQKRWLSIKKEYYNYCNEELENTVSILNSKYTQFFSPSYFQKSLKNLQKK